MMQLMKFQVLLKKLLQKNYHNKFFVKKIQIRKQLIKLRKKKFREVEINFDSIIKVIKKNNIKNKIVGGYYPYNHELDVTKILEKFEKKRYLICLPKIKKNFQMDFYKWSYKEPLKINKYGIPEPISNKIFFPDIILVPLVAYDKNLNRIGYSGGFYDRYIQKFQLKKKLVKIGIAYSFQKIPKILTDSYDMKLDAIVTEKN